jgi:translation elongation factor EF-Tu-like GTPase
VTAVEEKIGVVTDYLNRIGVAVIRLTDGDLRRGDQVRIAGRTTEMAQVVESLEIEHRPVEEALRGSEVGMKIADPVRRHDQVFRVREGAGPPTLGGVRIVRCPVHDVAYDEEREVCPECAKA